MLTLRYRQDNSWDPLRGMQKRLYWALGIATGLIAVSIITTIQMGAA